MRVVQDDLRLCQCCMIAACNGDGCQCGGQPDHNDAIDAGLRRLGPHLVPAFASEAQEGIWEFTNYPCDCCCTRLAGERYSFAILGE